MRPFLNLRCCFREVVVAWLAREVLLRSASHERRSRLYVGLFAAWRDRVALTTSIPHHAKLDAVLHSGVVHPPESARSFVPKVPFPASHHSCGGLCCVWKPQEATGEQPTSLQRPVSDMLMERAPPRAVTCDVLLWAAVTLLLEAHYKRPQPTAPTTPNTAADDVPPLDVLYDPPEREGEGLARRLEQMVQGQQRTV